MARRQIPLVTQHLESISRTALENYEEIIRQFVRRRHGIYALYRGNKLYYVGLASNLRSRLARHLRDRHAETWDRFSFYLTIGDRHLKELESLILRIATPKGNLSKGKFAQSDDLKRQFRRQIARSQRAELQFLFERPRPGARQVEGKDRVPKANRGVLAQYIDRHFKIRFVYKGKVHVARVRTDGRIRFKGKLYRSPSAAARAVVRRGIDGWFAWRYEQAPGDWVPIDELRRR